MSNCIVNQLNYSITGIASSIGKVIDMNEWARIAQIPHRKNNGLLDGDTIFKILGVRSKSFDPEHFRNPDSIVEIARAALESAQTRPDQIDAAVIVTCTPYQVTLDWDAFHIFSKIGVPESVVPIQMSAGCAGMARVMGLLSKITSENVLVVTYNLVSPYMISPEGKLTYIYQPNSKHPQASILWVSAAIFSDGAAAVVLKRSPEPTGFSFYIRDSKNFNGSIVYHPGGGVSHPIGFKGNDELCTFGLAGDEIGVYYSEGMLRNHEKLLEIRPDYAREVARIYTHQASPRLVKSFVDQVDLPKGKVPTNAEQIGNLVTPCTMKLFYDDVVEGNVEYGDDICVSVVGAGPERGAFILPSKVEEVVQV